MFFSWVPFLFSSTLFGTVGLPFLRGVFLEFVGESGDRLELRVQVDRRVAQLAGGDGNGLEDAEEIVPFRLGGRVVVGPRTVFLKGEPAGLNADGVPVVEPLAVIFQCNGELHGVLVVLVGTSPREGPHRVDGDGLDRLEESEAAERVERVGQAVFASTVDATLGLVGSPDAAAVGALKEKVADVLGFLDGLHGEACVYLLSKGVLSSNFFTESSDPKGDDPSHHQGPLLGYK